MKRCRIACALAAALLISGCQAYGTQREAVATQRPVCAVYFSPHGGCTQELLQVLHEARQTVQVQAYSFTSEPIAQALVAAHQRGVQVEVILDKGQQAERHSVAPRLIQTGIPVQIDSAHAIAHNKVMVVDGETVVTGSFNFTQGAEERNAENLLVIHDRALASQYAKNWDAHRAHSKLYAAVVSRREEIERAP